MKNIATVVVNWNRPYETIECLNSLSAQEEVTTKIIIVDNGSDDGSVKIIKNAFPQADILINQENLGFGRAANQGIEYAFRNGADFVLIINNDAFLAPDALKQLLNNITDDTGLIAPIVYYASNPELIWSSGGSVNKFLLEVRGDLRNKPRPKLLPRVLERDFITGCAFVIPKKTFEKIGLFDENFYMYYEDSDLSYRVRKAGLKLLVVTDAVCWHKVSMSSGGSDTPNERYWMAYSSVQFFRKHAQFWQYLFIAPFRFISMVKTISLMYLQGKKRSAIAYLHGIKDGLGKVTYAPRK